MSNVRAKFKCESVQNFSGSAEVKLSPVVNGSEENETFYKLTPGGMILLSLIEHTTAHNFIPGKEYYVDFTPAPKVEKVDPHLGETVDSTGETKKELATDPPPID